MTQSHLQALLEPIAKSYRDFHRYRNLGICWSIASAVIVALLALHELTGWWPPAALPVLGALIGIAMIVAWTRTGRYDSAYAWVTREIEKQNPRLNSLLLTAAEQKPDEATGQLNFLQQRVIDDALTQNQRQPWAQRYVERLFFAQFGHWIAFMLFAGFFAALATVAPTQPITLASFEAVRDRKSVV